MNKKILLGLGAALLLVSATGCGKVAKLENGQDAVVTFTNENVNAISINDLYEELKGSYGASVLVSMIDTKILDNEYETDSTEKAQIESQISTWLSTFGSESALLQQTSSYFGATTMEELREYLSLQYKRNLAAQDYAKEKVTESELKNYYDQKVFGDMKLKHILISVNSTTGATDDEKAAAEETALNTAKEVIQKLNDGGDFAELAKEYSTDNATKDNGGELDYVTYTDSMDENFIEAAKNLEVSKYTVEAVKSTYGYHIIYKEEQKDKPSLEEVTDTIKEKIATSNLNDDSTLSTKALIDIREKYGIKFEDEKLGNSYDILMQNTLNADNNSNS